MRIHISLDEQLVAEIDRLAGARKRKRSAFIVELIRVGLANERRTAEIESALGSLADSLLEGDEDPAVWLRRRRRGEEPDRPAEA